MQVFALILIIISSLVIIYQDFKKRLIHVGSIILLTVGLLGYRGKDIGMLFPVFLVNFIFLIFLMGTMYGYIWIRKGEKKLIDRYIGLGDVLMLIAFCFAYNLYNLTMFILISCVLCLLYWVIRVIFLKRTIIRLPLAGVMAIVHICITIACLLNSFDPLQEIFINL